MILYLLKGCISLIRDICIVRKILVVQAVVVVCIDSHTVILELKYSLNIKLSQLQVNDAKFAHIVKNAF